jgi:hypothetical protein
VKVAIHQPNFAPWLGFFDKLLSADLFVLLDTVPFTKRGYQNRARLKGAQGPQWLTVPVITRGRFAQPTREVEINEGDRWRRAHLRTVRNVFAKAPNRQMLVDCIEPIYERDGGGTLVDFNVDLLRRVLTGFEITTPMVMASDLGCEGHGTRLLIDLTRAVGADVYLSGPSGHNYLDPELFPQLGVRLEYHEFRPFEYPQLFGGFVPGLSCFDYIANVGFTRWPTQGR